MYAFIYSMNFTLRCHYIVSKYLFICYLMKAYIYGQLAHKILQKKQVLEAIFGTVHEQS